MRRIALITGIVTLSIATAGAGPLTWRFNTDGDLQGWTPANFRSVEVSDGMLRGVTDYDCMLTSPELNIEADAYTVVEFRVRSSVTGKGEVFWHQEGNRFSGERQKNHAIYASEEPRVYRSRVATVETWRGTIKRIRLDILNAAGAEIALDYVRITSAAQSIVRNAGFEDDFDRDGVPDGWQVDAAEVEWSRDYLSQGDRSLMIAAKRPDHGTATASQRVPIDRMGIHTFKVRIPRVEGDARLSAALRFFDVFGEELADGAVSLTRIERAESGERYIGGEFEVPRLAAEALLTLSARSRSARVWWDAVELRHVRDVPLPCEQPLETWRAKWIWAADTLGEDDAAAYFRRGFELPVAPEKVTAATLQITADDRYTLWLNGEQLSQSHDEDGWRTPETVDLTPGLVRGSNVLAVKANDVTSAEGLLAEAAIRWQGGQMLLLSDATWKAVGEAKDGWTAVQFDDSRWPEASVIAPAGSQPWGHVPYTYPGEREEVELVAVDCPAQIAAGEDLTISATVAKLPSTAAESPVRLILRSDGEEVLCWSRPVDAVTSQTEDGMRFGPITVHLSRFLAPATYSLALGFPRMRYAEREGIVVGDLKVRPPALSEQRPEVRVAPHGGLPTLFIGERPHPFMNYQELEVGPRRIDNMASAGVHLYFLRADDIGWQAQGTFDYTQWDAKVTRLLMHDPQARIIPAFTLSGRHHRWWQSEHPTELARTESGSTEVGIYHHGGETISLASQQWREESGEALRRFVTHCGSASYASRIIGYVPASGVSWEWQHWGSVGDFDPTDYSEPMQAAFREWVRARYDTEAALRKAWRMPEITFATVEIPSVEQRDGADHMLFRDPRTSRYVIDFYRFHQQVIADGILHYFRIIKDASDGRSLAGTYYGYVVTMLGGARRAGDSGHMALSTIIGSDLCDFLISPWDYARRDVGQPTTVMSAVGSVLANGKLWIMETDLRTHLVEDERQRGYGAPEHLDGTLSQLRRAFASAATKGLAVRWYDFSNGWISEDPRQAQAIGQLRDLADRWVNWDRSPETDGIAVVVDEDTPAAYLSHQIQAMYWLVYRQKAVFERVGAPWNIYLLNDVVAGRVPKMRAYFFLNCFHMTDEERAFIDNELKSDGRTLAWFYAPGYIADDLDVARISQLVNMDFREIEQMRSWEIALESDHAWADGITADAYPQPKIEIGPVFVPDESDVEVAGRWVDGGEPGLAVKRHEDWTSVYSAGPILSPALVKRICADAGVPIRVAGTEPSYVSRNLIGLHAAVTRTETLSFDRPTRVIDLVTGEILAAGCTELDVQVQGPGTRLLRTRPAY